MRVQIAQFGVLFRGALCRGRLSILAPGVLPWADLARLGNLSSLRLSPLHAGWQRRQLRSAHPCRMAPCCPGRPATIRRPAATRKTLVRPGRIEDMRLPAGLDGPADKTQTACPLAGKLLRPQPASRAGRAACLPVDSASRGDEQVFQLRASPRSHGHSGCGRCTISPLRRNIQSADDPFPAPRGLGKEGVRGGYWARRLRRSQTAARTQAAATVRSIAAQASWKAQTRPGW